MPRRKGHRFQCFCFWRLPSLQRLLNQVLYCRLGFPYFYVIARAGQRQVLERFYHCAGGNGWHRRDNWLSTLVNVSVSECGWYGVLCNGDDVLGLALDANGLSGPASCLGLLCGLPSLGNIEMASNFLRSALPDLSNCTRLRRIHLYENDLSGGIEALSLIPSLKYVYLDRNFLRGTLPDFALPLLEDLSLEENALFGTIPTFANSPMLTSLFLASNSFTVHLLPLHVPSLMVRVRRVRCRPFGHRCCSFCRSILTSCMAPSLRYRTFQH